MSRWFLTVMLNCSISECAGKLWADKTVHALLCGKPFMAKRQIFLANHNAAKHKEDVDGALFRPVKNNITKIRDYSEDTG